MRCPVSCFITVVFAGPLLLPGTSWSESLDAGTGQELQNVEVLDPGMRLADARRYMVAFNEALGVQCRDCHDLKDFASDAKELKRVARDMMKMQREINVRWFADAPTPRVTCWTCHQGERLPPGTSGAIDGVAVADDGPGDAPPPVEGD